MIRAVLDTSVLVSSILVPEGIPARVVSAWRAGRYPLVTSPPILAELHATLAYPRLRRKYALTDEGVDRLLALLAMEAETTSWEPDVSEARVRDPNDEMVLACAVPGQAAFIVSGDQDLLTLREYRDIRIVTAREFLACLDRADPPGTLLLDPPPDKRKT